MESSIQLFDYKDNTVRTVILNGQIWFVAKDIADILGFRDAYNATQCLEDNEKGTCKVSTFRGEQDMLIVNEPGIYRLIFRSNKPEAKAFQDWVYHEVLPALHHTGSYSMNEESKPVQVDPMHAAKMILEVAHIKDNQLALALDKVAKHYTGQSMLALSGIVLIAPTKHPILTPTEIGKHFGVSGKKINELLKDITRGNPFEGIGQPEALKEDLSGFWSRRIDTCNRLVYKIDAQGTLRIEYCKGHYE